MSETTWTRDAALDCIGMCEAAARDDAEAFGFLVNFASPWRSVEHMAGFMGELADRTGYTLSLARAARGLPGVDVARLPWLGGLAERAAGGDPEAWCAILAHLANVVAERYGVSLRAFAESLPGEGRP